ncbi:MAG: hypothetical protein EA398_05240 [Deltaproteobacteria bacterium]|nr:MAG: hypothetical protein EA398_05240 [Deltaproteobacteria bacterium]
MSKIDSIEKARRYARAMASDIQAYNMDKIQRAIEDDTLFEVLADELREAEKTWRDKVTPEIADNETFFFRAVVDQIFGSSRAKSPIF